MSFYVPEEEVFRRRQPGGNQFPRRITVVRSLCHGPSSQFRSSQTEISIISNASKAAGDALKSRYIYRGIRIETNATTYVQSFDIATNVTTERFYSLKEKERTVLLSLYFKRKNVILRWLPFRDTFRGTFRGTFRVCSSIRTQRNDEKQIEIRRLHQRRTHAKGKRYKKKKGNAK